MKSNLLRSFLSVFQRDEVAAKSATRIPSGIIAAKGYEVVGSPYSALNIATVFRCVTLICGAVSRLPLLYQRKNAATKTFAPFTSSPLYPLLALRPNTRQTMAVWLSSAVQQVLLMGNSYAYPRRGVDGEISELILLSPHSTYYDPYADVYHVTDTLNGISGAFPSSEILHFKGVSLDGGYTGVSVLTFAAQTLSIAATADRETRDRFASGGKHKMVYHQEEDGMKGFSAGLYDEDEMDAQADELEEKLNSGRSIIKVNGAGKLTPLSMNSTDLQFLESRKFTVTEIGRFFGVPAAKLMVEGGAGNYKSAGMVNVDFYCDALAPLLTMMEQEFTTKLIPQSLHGTHKVSFDISSLYAADPDTRASYESKALANGTATVNEIRRANDRPPVPDGDRPLISANLTPLDSITQTKTKSE